MTLAITPIGGTIWFLVCLAVVIALAGVWVFNHPEIVARGQDAAGKGMLTGCLGVLMCLVTAVLGAIAAGLAVWKRAELGWPTEVIAWLPLFGLTAALLIGYIAAQISRIRADEAREAKIAKIPVFVLVDEDDIRLTGMYDALRAHYQHVQMQLFKHPSALHWQQHWLPRAKLIALQADAKAADGSDLARETMELVEDIVFMNPGVHVILHAADGKDAMALAEKLKHSRIIESGADWIPSKWLPVALEILAQYPQLKEKQVDELNLM